MGEGGATPPGHGGHAYVTEAMAAADRELAEVGQAGRNQTEPGVSYITLADIKRSEINTYYN